MVTSLEDLEAVAQRRLALVNELEERLARMVFKVSDLYQENAKLRAVAEAAKVIAASNFEVFDVPDVDPEFTYPAAEVPVHLIADLKAHLAALEKP